MSNILVTGGYGFIGSNWVNNNYKDNNIMIIDNLSVGSNPRNITAISEDIDGIDIDICELKAENLPANGFTPEYIVHFAAESHVDRSISDPLGFVQTNVMGTANMLEIARHFNCRFLHVSTDEVFGHLGIDDDPFTETTPYAPRSPYSASKASSDHLVRAYHETYGLDVCISNCCNNFGSSQYEEKFIPKIIKNCFEKKPIPIYGKGENIREWIPVEKHNEALSLIMEKGKPGETYCIGSNVEKTNMQIVNIICEHINETYHLPYDCFDLITYVEDRKGHDLRYAISSEKLRTELEWSCDIDFEEELKSVVDQSFINKYKNFGERQNEIQSKDNNRKMRKEAQ
jgi:dTDP-glucose 4,6-dehydratase